VLIGLNMQTSFLTPPFGFALFYLRSVAPGAAYKDAVSGKRIEGIRTMQIYRGVIPFIVIQLVALVVIFAFPQLVTINEDPPLDVDLDTIELNIQSPDAYGGGGYGEGGYGGGGYGETAPAIPGADAPMGEGSDAAPAEEPDPNAALMDALREAAEADKPKQ